MAAQREKLYEDMTAERVAGNYVIAGGDYNHDMIGVSGEVYGNAAQAVESWAKPYDFDGVPEGFTVAAKAKLDETAPPPSPMPPPAATPDAPTTAPTTAGSWTPSSTPTTWSASTAPP